MKTDENSTYSAAVLVYEKRRNCYLTQVEVADAIGIPVRSYQRLEHGVQPIEDTSLRTGLILCAILDIDPYEMVFGTGKEELIKQIK